MGYYWTYYALTFFLAYAVHNPWVCGAVLVFLVMRRWLPDPVVLARTLSRIGSLRTQVQLNEANVPARRDLARAYLDLYRPRSALRYLDEARARDPPNPDIAYLRGVALLTGAHAGAPANPATDRALGRVRAARRADRRARSAARVW